MENVRKGSSFKLRDWLVSRQRKWGAPIPMKKYTVGKREGEWEIEERDVLNHFESQNNPKNLDFLPENDTLDTFVDSSWYFLRFLDPKNQKQVISISLTSPYPSSRSSTKK